MSYCSDEEIEQMRTLARKGWERRVIAQAVGRSVGCVNKILRGVSHRSWEPMPARVLREE